MRALAIGLALCCASPALGQSITAAGVARTVSSYYFVGIHCRDYFPVNTEQLSKVTEASLDLGTARFGAETMRVHVAAEIPRRAKEVEATGPQAWCTYQRAAMREKGLGFVFGN